MFMLETIFAMLAAVITIIIAGFLVKKQNEYDIEIIQINDKIKDNLEDIATKVAVLVGEEPSECTLSYLEQRMDYFNKTLRIVQRPTYQRRNKSVKRKKNIADD